MPSTASPHPEAIIVTRNGNRLLNRRLAGGHFALVTKRAGVPKIRFHDLRHTFASWYMLEVGDIWSLKDVLGHRDIQTTQRYAHITAKHQKASEGDAREMGSRGGATPAGAYKRERC